MWSGCRSCRHSTNTCLSQMLSISRRVWYGRGRRWQVDTDHERVAKAMLAGHDIKVWTGPGERYFVDRELTLQRIPPGTGSISRR